MTRQQLLEHIAFMQKRVGDANADLRSAQLDCGWNSAGMYNRYWKSELKPLKARVKQLQLELNEWLRKLA